MDASFARGIGDSIASFVFWTVLLLAIFLPLGLWKAIEIVVWLVRHVSVTVA